MIFVTVIFRTDCPSFVENCRKFLSTDSEYPSMDSKLGLEAPISKVGFTGKCID